MSQEITKKENTVASARKKFAEAIEKKDVYYAEIQPNIQELSLKGSVMTVMPKDVAELDVYRNWVKSAKNLKKQAGEYRLDTTRPLDQLVSSLIEEHRELFSQLDIYEAEITKQAMLFVAQEEKKAKDAKDKAEKEKNKNIEIETVTLKINNAATFALTEEIDGIRKLFNMSWASLKLEDFDSRITILKGYMPKIGMDKLLPKYFNFTYSHITPDEFEGLLRSNFDFQEFTTKLASAVSDIKKTFLDQADSKKEQLSQQTDKDRQVLITQTQNDEIALGAKALFEKEKAEQDLKTKEADIKLEAESNFVQVKGPAIKNMRRPMIAYINGVVDWNYIINLYLSENTDEKLKFLLTNLQKKGCPEVAGIAYKEETKLTF